VVGPVNAAVLLREARWVVETWKLAQLEKQEDDPGLKTIFGKAHAERLRWEHGLRQHELPARTDGSVAVLTKLLDRPEYQTLKSQGQVHVVLAVAPLVPIEELYRVVFEKILAETISTNPVQVAGLP
jgi:hypothetical protein